MEDNIYQTPKANLAVEADYSSYDLATTGQRFSNMLIDTVMYLIFSMIVGVILGVLGFYESLKEMNDTLFGLILMTVYFLPQEAIWGRTIGKLVTKTKVVSIDGKNVTFLKALGRTVCRIIPFEAFTFLGGDGHPHGLHDKLPKTKVISLKKAG